jgi:hypothetical protein
MGSGRSGTVVSHPEAAAAYGVKIMEPVLLQPGNNIVAYGTGGGTVGLITQHILSLRPLEVEESAVLNGGKCRSVFANRCYQSYM